MPKERRERSLSSDRPRPYLFPDHSSCLRQTEDDGNIQGWEQTRCPVCMEHPHNAILLICSSHEKGCHPFMCDTSYRHSNCFDQFLKSFGESRENMPNFVSPLTATAASEDTIYDLECEEGSSSINPAPGDNTEKLKVACPLCRGNVNGWTVIEPARRIMNVKPRSCACETCDFTGTYKDLRKHARMVHPLARPNDADPERQQKWRRLEWQRDLGDLISSLESPIGEEMTDERTLAIDDGGWLTVFLLVRIIRPQNTSRARAQVAIRRRRSSRTLWGETINDILDSRDDNIESLDSEQTRSSRRPTRRRLNNQESMDGGARHEENEVSDND